MNSDFLLRTRSSPKESMIKSFFIRYDLLKLYFSFALTCLRILHLMLGILLLSFNSQIFLESSVSQLDASFLKNLVLLLYLFFKFLSHKVFHINVWCKAFVIKKSFHLFLRNNFFCFLFVYIFRQIEKYICMPEECKRT